MTGEIIAGIFAVLTVLAAQHYQNKRHARDEAVKREELVAQLAADRRVEAEEQARQRREEQADLLARIENQNSVVFEHALQIAKVHQQDAERARVLAMDNAASHAECRAEVASLAGQMAELRVRFSENERTAAERERMSEADRGFKHTSFTALGVAEGTVQLVQRVVPKCTCGAFELVEDLVMSFEPRGPELVKANDLLRTPDTSALARVENTVDRIEAAAEKVAANLTVAQTAVDDVASDLADRGRRADATEGPPGEAADAFTRGPEDQPPT